METQIFNLIILDESGSMYSIMDATINNVNETVQTIRQAQRKHPEQQHFVTLITFNDDVKSVYECVPVYGVSELTEETYRPDCCTALYDAMGISLNALRKKVTKDDKVLVTVITDGCENASREYNAHAISQLVDELKDEGWVFAYIGANHDVFSAAGAISITNVMSFTATSEGTKAMGGVLSKARSRLFDKISKNEFRSSEANNNFFEEI